MTSPKGTFDDFNDFSLDPVESKSKKVKVEEVLKDFHAGMRSKDFLAKYGLSMGQFEELLKNLIRQGLLTIDEFKAWKARRPTAPGGPPPADREEVAYSQGPQRLKDNIKTFVLEEPEKNHAWAMQLFSTERDRLRGAQFKVVLHGKKYSFVIEKILYRGAVKMLARIPSPKRQDERRSKREQALEFISRYGWAAYLENRAFEANFQDNGDDEADTGRLVLIHCRNETFLAALHTPRPAINLYVGPSLDKIVARLSRTIDTSDLEITE